MSRPAAEPTIRTIQFTASDGVALVGDLVIPETPTMAAIVCHPHPQYGGDRFNHVVSSLFSALPSAGVAALRFDFRSDFTGGPGERLDAIAAVDVLDEHLPNVPVAALGYSFGAIIALSVDDARVTALGLIAPPLAMVPTAAPTVRTLVLTPAHDQFSPPAESSAIVAEWHDAPVEHHTVEMADHSLVGHTASVAAQVTAWLSP